MLRGKKEKGGGLILSRWAIYSFELFLSIPFLESGSRKPKIPLSDTGYGCILIRVLSSGSKKGEEIREPREQREGL